MTKFLLVDLVRDTLNEYDIEIMEKREIEGHTYLFLTPMAMIFVQEDCILLSFHVSTKPEDAAKLVLVMQEAGQVEVIQSFTYSMDKEYLSGEEAHKEFEKQQAKSVIEEFMKEQKNLFDLASADAYHC